MSTFAKSLLILAILSGALSLLLPESSFSSLPLIACGTFGGLFVLALIIGRRIKFDPVLR
ncbi:PA3371 family protein [Pseudomonas sp. QD4]|uniref:PA3371 family protein n=1 Tax=Pseudomonas sp. QD4 TaxID=3368618 RepID=UPI003B9FA009